MLEILAKAFLLILIFALGIVGLYSAYQIDKIRARWEKEEYEALRLKAAAMEMVEGTGLEWWRVVKYKDNPGDIGPWALDACRDRYTLALGIVEGKPVWEGDMLYSAQGVCFYASCKEELEGCSWNPPKPKTVMVELPTTIAFAMTATKIDYETPVYHFTTSDLQIVSEACRKALENLK